jgi:hypothetical protein
MCVSALQRTSATMRIPRPDTAVSTPDASERGARPERTPLGRWGSEPDTAAGQRCGHLTTLLPLLADPTASLGSTVGPPAFGC